MLSLISGGTTPAATRATPQPMSSLTMTLANPCSNTDRSRPRRRRHNIRNNSSTSGLTLPECWIRWMRGCHSSSNNNYNNNTTSRSRSKILFSPEWSIAKLYFPSSSPQLSVWKILIAKISALMTASWLELKQPIVLIHNNRVDPHPTFQMVKHNDWNSKQI